MKLADLLKKVAFRYTSWFRPQYRYNTEPIQLATLICEIERLKETNGAIIEIGVARGLTTRFLCEHMKKSGITQTPYYALDTFGSFIQEDMDYEIDQRGRRKGQFTGHFGYNDFATWQKNFRDFPFVKAIQADCSTFDYASTAPIKLAFLDVDLYLPTQKALPMIYQNLVTDGIILVDDVQDGTMYDGAYQSYMEFCKQNGIEPQIIGNKCGIIRKLGTHSSKDNMDHECERMASANAAD